MNRLIKLGIAGLVSAGLFTSCATKAYVEEQLKPIKEKQAKLESKVNNLKKEHEDIIYELNNVDRKATEALNTAEIANKKADEALNIAKEAKTTADKNSEEITNLKAKLKRINHNTEALIEKGLRK